MRANYAGTCAECHQSHIQPGDLIEKRLTGYASRDCVRKAELIRHLTTRISEAMHVQEGIGLGTFGIPAGCRSTPTRERFYTLALSLDHCTPREFTELANYYAGQGLWQRTMDD